MRGGWALLVLRCEVLIAGFSWAAEEGGREIGGIGARDRKGGGVGLRGMDWIGNRWDMLWTLIEQDYIHVWLGWNFQTVRVVLVRFDGRLCPAVFSPWPR